MLLLGIHFFYVWGRIFCTWALLGYALRRFGPGVNSSLCEEWAKGGLGAQTNYVLIVLNVLSVLTVIIVPF